MATYCGYVWATYELRMGGYLWATYGSVAASLVGGSSIQGRVTDLCILSLYFVFVFHDNCQSCNHEKYSTREICYSVWASCSGVIGCSIHRTIAGSLISPCLSEKCQIRPSSAKITENEKGCLLGWSVFHEQGWSKDNFERLQLSGPILGVKTIYNHWKPSGTCGVML